MAAPSTAITGIVRDASTNEPLKGITIKSQARDGEPIFGLGQDFVRTETDANGRFVLSGMPIGRGNQIAAVAPRGDKAYFSTGQTAVTTAGGETTTNFDLPRGVWIVGRVTNSETGNGLNGRLTYNVGKENPARKKMRLFNVDERDRLRTNDQGYYRIAVWPGPGYISFLADGSRDYPRAKGIVTPVGETARAEDAVRTIRSTMNRRVSMTSNHIVVKINPAEDATRRTLNLELDTGTIATGRVVDSRGQPVVGFYHSGRQEGYSTWDRADGDRFKLSGYDPESPRHVYFVHQERQLAGHAVIEGELPEDLVVTLQPAGKITGRLVDEDGTPLADWRLVPRNRRISPDEDLAQRRLAPPLPHNARHRSSAIYITDEEGRFHMAGLAPGVSYRLFSFRLQKDRSNPSMPARSYGRLDVDIRLQPNESKDLGDVKLAVDSKTSAGAAGQPKS